MTFSIERIDHIVITVKDIEKTTRFYCDVLGMQEINFGDNRRALAFGNQKINLHPISNDLSPKASNPTPGALDICLVTETALDDVVSELNRHRIHIEKGPIERQGALGIMSSVYFRDPDGNLVEVAHYGN